MLYEQRTVRTSGGCFTVLLAVREVMRLLYALLPALCLLRDVRPTAWHAPDNLLLRRPCYTVT
jgi:hypothetical protein